MLGHEEEIEFESKERGSPWKQEGGIISCVPTVSRLYGGEEQSVKLIVENEAGKVV